MPFFVTKLKNHLHPFAVKSSTVSSSSSMITSMFLLEPPDIFFIIVVLLSKNVAKFSSFNLSLSFHIVDLLLRGYRLTSPICGYHHKKTHQY